MRRILAGLTLAAAGFAAASMYRQWKERQAGAPHHRVPLETWENEGGALPEAAASGTTANSEPRTKKTPL